PAPARGGAPGRADARLVLQPDFVILFVEVPGTWRGHRMIISGCVGSRRCGGRGPQRRGRPVAGVGKSTPGPGRGPVRSGGDPAAVHLVLARDDRGVAA